MKTNSFNKISGILVFLLCAAMGVHAQQRFGGFGGFGGFNRNSTTGSSSSSTEYNNNGTVGSATISVDPVTHNIVVIADKDTSEQIGRVIASLDAPEPQVLIKVVFVEVDDNKASAIGLQGSYNGVNNNFSQITSYVTNYAVVPGGNNAANTIVPTSITPVQQSVNAGQSFGLPQSLSGATGSGGVYQFLGSDFTATIQALATAGKAQILSRPSILARDGQQAEIVVGQSVYLPSSVSLTTVGNSAATVPTINGSYQNVGIQLDVTPFIGANNLVQMILQPQITSIDTSTPGQVIQGGSLLTSAVYAPNLNKRSANTVVVTPDGMPVVIGGLIGSNKASNESKIPLLGDIPILGQLFRYTAKSNTKNELLIFLTPHVVRMPNQLAAMSSHETGQSQMITNSVPEQELDRLLDRLPVKPN
jgi:general secretion pathway protein D